MASPGYVALHCTRSKLMQVPRALARRKREDVIPADPCPVVVRSVSHGHRDPHLSLSELQVIKAGLDEN
jgi:hypothetical protein